MGQLQVRACVWCGDQALHSLVALHPQNGNHYTAFSRGLASFNYLLWFLTVSLSQPESYPSAGSHKICPSRNKHEQCQDIFLLTVINRQSLYVFWLFWQFGNSLVHAIKLSLMPLPVSRQPHPRAGV